VLRGAVLRLSASIQVGPTTFSSGGGMTAPPSTVTQAEKLPLCHIYSLLYLYCLGRARQPIAASSIAEEHSTV